MLSQARRRFNTRKKRSIGIPNENVCEKRKGCRNACGHLEDTALVTVVAILIVKSALKQTILGETAPIIHGQLGRNLQLAKIGLRLMMKRVEGFYTST